MTAREQGWWRLRVVLVVLPAAVALLAATSLAPSGGLDDAPRVPGASETTCLPAPQPDSVADLNRFAEQVRGGGEFQGGDIGADTELQDGRRLFVFGDTLRSASFDGQRFVRNSMLVFSDDCAQVVLPADHGALVPDRADGVGYWPMSIASVEREGYDLVGVAMQRVRSTADPMSDAFAFENLGPASAIFLVPRGRTPQLIEVRDLGPDSADPARPMWGAAAEVVGDTVYLYGTARPDEDGVFGFSLRVARVRVDDLLDQSRWRYWDGERWSARAEDATALIPAVGGVSQTLSVFRRGGRWYALSKRDEFLGSDLTVWTAPGPTGPFTPSDALARIPSNAVTGTLRYTPLAHPDLLARPGSVVVSYSRNNTDVGKVVADPTLYRPRFLRVPLPE